jgi:hypothetical protein
MLPLLREGISPSLVDIEVVVEAVPSNVVLGSCSDGPLALSR